MQGNNRDTGVRLMGPDGEKECSSKKSVLEKMNAESLSEGSSFIAIQSEMIAQSEETARSQWSIPCFSISYLARCLEKSVIFPLLKKRQTEIHPTPFFPLELSGEPHSGREGRGRV